MPFLPMNEQEMRALGWDNVDFVCVTGDAYVDHPSFGVAIIARVLEAEGFRVGMLAQPDWKNPNAFAAFGRPRFGFFVTAGNVDSMVAHYTAAKRRRSDDAYTPGGKAGKRPDRAATVYSQAIKRRFPDCPVVLGGLEASLRRFAHYDYWDDAVRPSILVESGADLISFGMGERQTRELARRLAAGEDISALTDVRGTVWLAQPGVSVEGAVAVASYEKVKADKTAYARATGMQMNEQDDVTGRPLVQKHGDRLVVQNAPARALETDELDAVFELPYMRMYHPAYKALGGVPAIEEVEFSIIHNRGCFGGCNFCSISYHQGRRVTCRSADSVVREAEALAKSPRFKGFLHDVGGPTANFRGPSSQKQATHGLCRDKRCLAPTPCAALRVDHSDYLALLRRLRAIPGVKQVFIRSGIRYDYVMADPNDAFFTELVAHHVSGQLKVAPEHCSARVLDAMGKPHIDVYERFQEKFYRITKRLGKEQYLVPYLISSHPGSTLKDAVQLALFLKRNNIRPEQVQDFYPTPAAISTCMFYTGLDPATMKPIFVPRTAEEKAMQRALLQYFKPENRRIIKAALLKAERPDLIGNGKDCLIPPDAGYIEHQRYVAQQQPGKKVSRYAKGKPKQRPQSKKGAGPHGR